MGFLTGGETERVEGKAGIFDWGGDWESGGRRRERREILKMAAFENFEMRIFSNLS